ncbi:hypothetical protein PHLGIDRAFT_19941 [Phlebiopsis gigantea 11061_1 CR5-6]|uniref:Cell division control protein 14 n=1 Tax=Phlebiopsis gigantea (strain 11061_1 CR5-6) TaxID=745531 RepID=A0A0C3S779_PHLG1|nr:hypothetical protein PHLGIDRAFT_19941 [Phlebiopsis gigantea 11061_1 CR5-6]
MNNAIQDALDDLSSFRSSISRQGRALDALERLLADLCVSGNHSSLQSFIALQDTFQANIPSRLLTWISDRSSHLDTLSLKGTVAPERVPEVTTLSLYLIQSLSIIQGTVLIHSASKQFLGRRFALEILVDLFLVARHVTQTPLTSATNTAENISSSKSRSSTPVSLAGAVLDTLLCIMVDSPAALRAFEEANGVRTVVRILKRAGTPRETRMKCLEFLYFYLLDENTPASNTHSRDGPEIPTAPNSPTAPSHTRSALSLSQISDCSSSSDYSTSSGGSNLSVSTAATSIASSSPSSPTSKEVFSLAPSPSIRSGPRNMHSREPSASRPRSPLMLRKDIELTPQTPVAMRSTVTPTSRAAPRLGQQNSDSALPPLSEWKMPRRMPPRMQATSFGDIDASTPVVSMRARGHRRAHTVDVQADANVLAPLIKSPLISPERREATPSSAVNTVLPPRRQITTRTMEEKKAILGSMMGNVDTLVEGVKKAGIWGLG